MTSNRLRAWFGTKVLCVLGLAILTASSSAQPLDWSFDCNTTFGVHTTMESLTGMFGLMNVIDAEIPEAEGLSEQGTLVFPGSQSQVEIVWQNPTIRQSLRRVRIRGDASNWQMSNGLELGLDLKSIEMLNGASFELTGFGWDYGGTVMSWENGALASDMGDGCLWNVRFQADFSQIPIENIEEHGTVLGEATFSSRHPIMQALNPMVVEISLIFE